MEASGTWVRVPRRGDARAAAAALPFVVMVALVAAAVGPRLAIVALAARDAVDRATWREFVAWGIVVPLALAAVAAVACVERSVRRHGWRGWTQVVIDEHAMTVGDGRRRCRIPWNGMRIAFTGRDVTVKGPAGERAILDGWWMRERGEPAPIMRSDLGEQLARRCPPSVARVLGGLITTLVVSLALGLAWASAWLGTFHRLDAVADVEYRGMLPLSEGRSAPAAVLAREAPRSSMAQAAHAWALLGDRRAAEALAVADAAMELGEPRFVLGARSRALEALGRPREAARDAAGLIPWQGHAAAMEASRLLALAGDRDAARRMAQRAVAMRDVPGTRARLREAERPSRHGVTAPSDPRAPTARAREPGARRKRCAVEPSSHAMPPRWTR